ncbi:MAG: hypothetical protein KKD35_06490 [Elusimicrobia bacterium]|nr:hypothetical protein [Elusimicrobiota bacterium]
MKVELNLSKELSKGDRDVSVKSLFKIIPFSLKDTEELNKYVKGLRDSSK